MYLSESEIKQLELLKKKSPAERFMMMVNLINSQIAAMKAGIKYQNPQLSDEELNRCLKARMEKIYSWKL